MITGGSLVPPSASPSPPGSSAALSRAGQPALVLYGDKCPARMAATAASVAEALPDGRAEAVPDIGRKLATPLAAPITAFLRS
jgi:hypothetical protein